MEEKAIDFLKKLYFFNDKVLMDKKILRIVAEKKEGAIESIEDKKRMPCRLGGSGRAREGN